MFDRSAADAEHFEDFLFRAKLGILRRFRANATLFGKFLSNTCANGYASCRTPSPDGRRQATCWSNRAMASETNDFPLALRPREAAKALGISPRLLWQLTHDGEIPCVRIGTGTRRTVLYPIATLAAWLEKQVEPAQGGDDDHAA
ncbi:MAG: helix-turn-helix domain-containing protein [Pirellulales bacterium]